ncbi:hypothetical protein V8E53_003088 [Lactarius tabidus]
MVRRTSERDRPTPPASLIEEAPRILLQSSVPLPASASVHENPLPLTPLPPASPPDVLDPLPANFPIVAPGFKRSPLWYRDSLHVSLPRRVGYVSAPVYLPREAEAAKVDADPTTLHAVSSSARLTASSKEYPCAQGAQRFQQPAVQRPFQSSFGIYARFQAVVCAKVASWDTYPSETPHRIEDGTACCMGCNCHCPFDPTMFNFDPLLKLQTSHILTAKERLPFVLLPTFPSRRPDDQLTHADSTRNTILDHDPSSALAHRS